MLFCPSWSCTIICCINRFTSLCNNLLNLLELLAEAFRCHVHHFQCLTVPVEQWSESFNTTYYSARSRWTKQLYFIILNSSRKSLCGIIILLVILTLSSLLLSSYLRHVYIGYIFYITLGSIVRLPISNRMLRFL